MMQMRKPPPHSAWVPDARGRDGLMVANGVPLGLWPDLALTPMVETVDENGRVCSGSPSPVLGHASIAEFEAATPTAELVARNLVATVRRVGARYITFTVVHSCDGWAVMYPTRVPGFIRATTRDYVGALLAEGTRTGVKIILYMPGGMGHWDTPGGPWVGENLRTPEGYADGLTALVRELVERYGAQIGGFWLDGLDEKLNELPVLLHRLLPEAVVLVNNRTRFNSPDVDVSRAAGPLHPERGAGDHPVSWADVAACGAAVFRVTTMRVAR